MTAANCRICAQALFEEPLLVQHAMPAAAQGLPTGDRLAEDRGVTLDLRQCSGCGIVQLTNTPVPYWRDVIRAAGISPEMRAFRLKQFEAWIATHGLARRKVLEVGCGRGEYLALLAESGAAAYGIEHHPEAVETCQAAGLSVTRDFIAGPESIVANGPFDGFIILNFLEHLPDAHLTLRGIGANLVAGAIGLVEVPNFDMIVRAGLFAEFIPDHLYYFTRKTLTGLLEANGFEILDCRPEWHDYLLAATVRKRKPLNLAPLTALQVELQASFDAFLAGFAPDRVAIWGAGHQALSLISLMALAPRVRFVLDSAPFKQGRFTPATHLPIVPPTRLDEGEVDAVIVLAASYSDEVVGQIYERYGHRFTVATLRGNRLETVVAAEGRP